MARHTSTGRRPWRGWLACALLASWITDLAGAQAQPGRAQVHWVIDQRDLDFGPWLNRLALGAHGVAWVGGGPPATDESAGRVYAHGAAGWRRLPALAAPGTRTFALSADPAGGLWVAAYVPDAAQAYAQLDLYHWDRARWQVRSLRPGLWPQAMAWAAPDEAWIAGNRGLFYHLAAGRWRLEALDVDARQRADRHIHALVMNGREEGWAVGARGLVARYRTGRWRPIAVPAEFEPRHLHGLDRGPDGRLWVVGTGGLLASYDGTWHVWPLPVTTTLTAIDMPSADDGWAVGDGGVILRFDGQRWTRQASPTTQMLTDVRLTSARSGWITGATLVLRATSAQAPRFVDVSSDHQELANRGASQLAALDADDDGDPDLFCTERTGVRVLENHARQTWIDRGQLARPAPAGASAARPGGAAWGDADGDGRVDVLLLGEPAGATALHRGLGALDFAAPRALASDVPLGDAAALMLFDLDGDGAQDLHVLRPQPRSPGAAPTLLLGQDGAGHFRARGAQTAGQGARVALWGDVDGDLDLDLVVASDGGRTELLLNTGGLDLRPAEPGSGLEALHSGVINQGALLDLDRDGDLDLLLLDDRLHALLNDGHARFTESHALFDALDNNSTVGSGLIATGDLDHDGDPEVLLGYAVGDGARSALFTRGADGRYHDVAEAAGLRDLAGQAAVFADWDGDGDLDLALAAERRSYLLLNQQNDGRFLTVRLRAAGGQALAIGGQVRVYDRGHGGQAAHLRGFQVLGVGLPASALAQASELVFGLPDAGRYDVEARFPSGQRVWRHDVPAGQRVTLRERPWPLDVGLTAARAARRAALRSDWRWEGPRLLIVLLLASTLGLELTRRLGAARAGWGAGLALLALYALLAITTIDARPLWRLGLPVLGSTGGAALVLLGGRTWQRWRVAHHLGPYRLLAVLGEGGMGIVYRARHVITRRSVALKALHPRVTAEEPQRLRFLREGTIATQLEHPNVVRVFEAGEIGGRGFIAMELLEGGSLGEWLRQRGPLPARQAAGALSVAAEALAYVHARGIVHRDVKTDNLFLVDARHPLPDDIAGWRQRLKLADFGLARSRTMATLTVGPGVQGTLAYLAPEQLRGQPAEMGSDVYALGVVGHELVTGRLLADTPVGGPDCPPAWAELLGRLLRAQARDRPTCADVARACAALAAGLSPTWTTTATVEPEALSGGAAWQARLDALRACLAEQRLTEAQVLLVELLGEVRHQLRDLPASERPDFARRHALHELLALEREARGTR